MIFDCKNIRHTNNLGLKFIVNVFMCILSALVLDDAINAAHGTKQIWISMISKYYPSLTHMQSFCNVIKQT